MQHKSSNSYVFLHTVVSLGWINPDIALLIFIQEGNPRLCAHKDLYLACIHYSVVLPEIGLRSIVRIRPMMLIVTRNKKAN